MSDDIEDRFFRKVLLFDGDWAFVTPRSEIYDFLDDENEGIEQVNARIKEVFGCDLTALDSDNVTELLAAIRSAGEKR